MLRRGCSCLLLAMASACAVVEEGPRDGRASRDSSAEAARDSGAMATDSGGAMEAGAPAMDGGGAPSDAAVTPTEAGSGAGDAGGDAAVDAGAGPDADGGGARCGDGRVDPGEQCDDGNRADTDACRNTCRVGRCGDGVVRVNVEECDDGNTVPNDGCTTACVRCSTGGSVEEPMTGACFRREDAALNFSAMRARCEAAGDQLAVFSSREEWGVIQATLISGRPSVWIGATDAASEGSWLWVDGSPMMFSAWAPGEPNNSGDEDCVEAADQWNDLNCGDARPGVCQRTGWAVRASDGHAYRLWTRAVPFAEAEAACSAIGAHLVTLSDTSERAFVRGVARGASAWIGLEDRGTEGSFRWVTGEPVRETAWAPGEPNNAGDEDCAQLVRDDTWNDLSCATALPFVCEAE